MKISHEIVEFIRPALRRHYINGAHKYHTAWGTKSIEGIEACIQRIIDKHEEKELERRKSRKETDPIDRCQNCGRGYNDRENKQEHLCQRCKKKGDKQMRKTIRKNQQKKAREIFANAQNIKAFMLANGFTGKPVNREYYHGENWLLRDWNNFSSARLIEEGDNKYCLRINGSCWYEFTSGL